MCFIPTEKREAPAGVRELEGKGKEGRTMFGLMYSLEKVSIGLAVCVILSLTDGVPEPSVMALLPLSALAILPAFFVGVALDYILCRVFYKCVRLWDGSETQRG